MRSGNLVQLMLAAILPLGLCAVQLDFRKPAKPGASLQSAVPQELEQGELRRTDLAVDEAPRSEGSFAVGDTVDLILFDDVAVTLTLKERTPTTLGSEAYLAEVSGYEGVNNAVFVKTGDGFQVDIRDFKNGKSYSVYSSSSGVSIHEREPVREPCVDGEREIDASRMSTLAEVRPQIERNSSSVAIIDILVAYDSSAASWAKNNGGGTENFAQVQVQKMNTAIANTGLNSYYRFRLAGVCQVGGSCGGDLGLALDAACYGETLNGVSWDCVRRRREEVGADIVCVLADNGKSTGTTGLGYSLKSGSESWFSSYAYNACLIRAVNNGHTMTHEVGHNMGAGHATAVSPSYCTPGPQYHNYSAGYYFRANSKAYHTIMAYNYDGYGNYYTSVPYFSSPSHRYAGVAVGNPTHDNTRTLRQTFMDVADFRTQVLSLTTALDSLSLTFTDGGDVMWTPQMATTHDGDDAVQSGPISNNQTSSMRATVSGAGLLTFWWKVSSETGYDKLHFKVDGVDVVPAISGEVDWVRVSYSLSSGTHALTWSYEKDGSAANGEDCGWVDQVKFSPLMNKPIITCDDSYSITPGKKVSIPIKAISLIKATTVMVSGLPSGLTFSKGKIVGTAKKPGTKSVTIVAKNSKGSAKKTIKIVAVNPGFSVQVVARPDGVSADAASTIVSSGESVSLHAGVRQSFAISSTPRVSGISGSGATVTVKGLPPGLAYKSGKISGVATKTGQYTATLTFKNKWGWSRSFKLILSVMSLRASGSYSGFLSYDWAESEEGGTMGMDPLGIVDAYSSLGESCDQPVKVSVSSAGKITAKVGTVSFSANGFTSESNGIYRVKLTSNKKITSGTYKGCTSSKSLNLAVDTNVAWDGRHLKGYYSTSVNSCHATVNGCLAVTLGAVLAQKNPFGKDSLGNYRNIEAGWLAIDYAHFGSRGLIVSKVSASQYELACPECVYIPAGKSPILNVKAKISTSGVVSVTGTIAGKKISGTAVLEVGEREYDEEEWSWSRTHYARFLLKPDSKTTIRLMLYYYEDDDWGFYSPCGWATVTK